jgi:hypothetical protein
MLRGAGDSALTSLSPNYVSPDDPAWQDALLFYECFRGDSGAGLGASHQTGWTGLVADRVAHLSRARKSRASS